MKGKALKRAMVCNDNIRLDGNVPLIVDKTELITPQTAHEMLQHNKRNRPINWKKVEEYAELMSSGKWKLHPQGIILDKTGNILTGQKRLWAVIYSDMSVYMRVSRGCLPDAARMIDRGTPQTARDLATRETERKHSQIEASLAKGISILNGDKVASPDKIADIIINRAKSLELIVKETKGTKKTKSVLMILSAVCFKTNDPETIKNMAARTVLLAGKLEENLLPSQADKCWGRGVAFVLAMEQAKKCIENEMIRERI